MDFIKEPLIVGVIFYFIYMVFELFVRRRERLELIGKMGQVMNNPNLSVMNNPLESSISDGLRKSFTALRTGCLLIGLGVGLLIGLTINLSIYELIDMHSHWEREAFISIGYGSCVLLFGGLGLVISYIIEKKEAR